MALKIGDKVKFKQSNKTINGIIHGVRSYDTVEKKFLRKDKVTTVNEYVVIKLKDHEDWHKINEHNAEAVKQTNDLQPEQLPVLAEQYILKEEDLIKE